MLTQSNYHLFNASVLQSRLSGFANLDDLKAKYRNVSVSPLYKWGLFGGKFVHEKKLKVKYFGVYFENMKGGLSYRIINSAPSTNTLYMNSRWFCEGLGALVIFLGFQEILFRFLSTLIVKFTSFQC